MHFVIAIDPGDEHVGVATWVESGEGERGRQTYELNYTMAALDAISATLRNYADKVKVVMVVERFSLYQTHAMKQVGSTMETAQMIGALKYIAHLHQVEVVEQGADIKKPTRAQLKARKIKIMGKGTHARDAYLHLAHYCLKEELWSRTSPS